MNKRQVNETIRKIEPYIKKGSDEFIAYQVLLAAAIVGPYQQPIIKFLKTKNWKRVIDFVKLAKKHKIFVDGKLCSEIYLQDTIGLALGVCLLRGYVQRAEEQLKEAL